MENKSNFLFNSAAWLLIRFSSMASMFLNVHPDSICWQLYIFSGNSVQASSWVILDLILNESFSVTLSVTTLPINFKMVIWQGSSFACLLTSSLGISLPIHSSVFRKRSPGWFGSFKLRKVYTWPVTTHSSSPIMWIVTIAENSKNYSPISQVAKFTQKGSNISICVCFSGFLQYLQNGPCDGLYFDCDFDCNIMTLTCMYPATIRLFFGFICDWLVTNHSNRWFWRIVLVSFKRLSSVVCTIQFRLWNLSNHFFNYGICT